MTVQEITQKAKSDYCEEMEDKGIEIKIDDKSVFNVSEGEPEDFSMGRDLNDLYNILDLMEQMYKLGKEGKEVIFERTEED